MCRGMSDGFAIASETAVTERGRVPVVVVVTVAVAVVVVVVVVVVTVILLLVVVVAPVLRCSADLQQNSIEYMFAVTYRGDFTSLDFLAATFTVMYTSCH